MTDSITFGIPWKKNATLYLPLNENPSNTNKHLFIALKNKDCSGPMISMGSLSKKGFKKINEGKINYNFIPRSMVCNIHFWRVIGQILN